MWKIPVTAFVLIFTLLFSAYSVAFSVRIKWPWGGETNIEIEDIEDVVATVVNPQRHINITGIPTNQDFVEFVVTNPDSVYELAKDPDLKNAVYVPVATAMIAGRNAVIVNGGGLKIPLHVREALKGFFTEELMDSVRWSTNWSLVENTLQAAKMKANPDTQAVALINAVIFRDAEAADEIGTWAHELYHVKQYTEWGVLKFAEKWVQDTSESGSVEKPAYEFEAQVEDALRQQDVPMITPIKTEAFCSEFNESTAKCNLFASKHGDSVNFVVSGFAYATGHGDNKGKMKLIMVADGAACNEYADAEVAVDNATDLHGEGYSCNVRVAPGEIKTVTIVSPNFRADASYTRGKAEW